MKSIHLFPYLYLQDLLLTNLEDAWAVVEGRLMHLGLAKIWIGFSSRIRSKRVCSISGFSVRNFP